MKKIFQAFLPSLAITWLCACSENRVEEHRLNIKDLHDIILNKDALCLVNEPYGLYQKGEQITFEVAFFSELSATLDIDGEEYDPVSKDAWQSEYVFFTMPDRDVSVTSLLNGCVGDELKLASIFDWGSLISEENLDYADVKERYIGVSPEKEWGQEARISNEDGKISTWFNGASIREESYGIDGGSGYAVSFALKDGSSYKLNLFNNFVCEDGRYYRLVWGLPNFLAKSFE